MTPAEKAFAVWWLEVCPHQDIVKGDPQKAYRRIARLAFVAGTKWMGEELGVERITKNHDYELWLIVVRFMEDLTTLASEQHVETVAEFKKVGAELKEKIEEANRLYKEEAAVEKEANIPPKVQRGTFIIGTTSYQKLYSELAGAVKDLLHVTQAKNEVSVDMMKPLSRLSRLVEGEAKESEEKA